MKLSGKIIGAAVGGALLLSSSAAGTEKTLASGRLIQGLTAEISGEIAYRYAGAVSRFDRVQASEGFHEAAAWVEKELERIGYKDINLEGWPSDGTRKYSTYRSVIGWRTKKALLWMISPERQRLCDFAETPLVLVKFSHSADCEAELVDVGSGIGEGSYSGRDVKGKIVLATGYTEDVMREAVLRRGAIGIVTYYAPDTRPGYPNMIRYTALWPRWEEREKMPFAFNVSKNQGAMLKRLLEEGKKVVLKAEVDTEYYQSRLETLTTAFPGTDASGGEILIIGHLCHPAPSANDNASGSGGMLEMARALKAMVDKGLVEAPRRTIRFLWVPEFNGTFPYILAHRDRIAKTLAGINCDMIGENICLSGSPLLIVRTPDSLPGVLNDVAENFASLITEMGLTSLNGSTHSFVWKSVPYMGGSDHVIFNDGALRVPCLMINHDDVFHHTSLDTMDKVDPTGLRRACFLTLGTAIYLASAGEEEALDMARLVARNGVGRIAADAADAMNAMITADGPEKLHAAYAQAINVVSHSVGREKEAIRGVRIYASSRALDQEIALLEAPIDALRLAYPKQFHALYRRRCLDLKTSAEPFSWTAEEKTLSRIVPVRSSDFIGSLDPSYLVEKVGPESLKDLPSARMIWYEALNFSDGKRSVLDIVKAVSAEYGPVAPNDIMKFFAVMEKAGLFTFKRGRT
jgi:aminopeptidase-like protein